MRLHVTVCIMHKRVILFTLRAFLRSFANTKGAIVRPRTHLLNFSFAFIVSFFFFFSLYGWWFPYVYETYVRESLHCNHSRTRRIPFFWPETLPLSGTYTTRMRTAYYWLQHYFWICAPRQIVHSSHNYPPYARALNKCNPVITTSELQKKKMPSLFCKRKIYQFAIYTFEMH